MKTILVPTDFSENAANAIEYAAEYAVTFQSKMLLLHVYTPQPAAYGMEALVKEMEQAKKEMRNRLNVIAETVQHEYPTVQCTAVFKEGDIVNEIIAEATGAEADFIIMGTQGASGLEKIIFGTNTQAVIEKAPCPVLSIPEDAPFIIPQKILFATNFSYGNVKGAVELTELVKRFDASIIIGHVKLPNEKPNPEKSIEKFSKEITYLTDYPKISYQIFSENKVALGLDSLIEETGADMIALSTRRRNLFEKFYNPSVTKKFASHSKIPLLAFHSSDESRDDETIDF